MKLIITTPDGARYSVDEEIVRQHMNSVYDDDRGEDADGDELVEWMENSMDYDDFKDDLVLETIPLDLHDKIADALCYGEVEVSE